ALLLGLRRAPAPGDARRRGRRDDARRRRLRLPGAARLGRRAAAAPGRLRDDRRGPVPGLAVTLSTNGTMITPAVADRLAGLGVRYAGVSLDAIGPAHDAFRGRRGAFER